MQQKLHFLQRQLNAFANTSKRKLGLYSRVVESRSKKQRGYQSFSERSYAGSIVLEAGWVGSYGVVVLCWNCSCWCLVAWGEDKWNTLSTLFVLAFRAVGLWDNFNFFVGRLFDFGSGIGAVGWRRTLSSVFLSKGLAGVASRLEAKESVRIDHRSSFSWVSKKDKCK